MILRLKTAFLLHLDGSTPETKFKLLGAFISSDQSLDSHVTHILQKVAKRIYCIIYFVKAGVPVCDISCVYCTVINASQAKVLLVQTALAWRLSLWLLTCYGL